MSDRERRKEPRVPIDSVILPLLGSRDEDHVCFQYVPLNISSHGICIALPQWLVMRERLKEGDLISLHVPFEFQGKSFGQGQIIWTVWDDPTQTQTCGLALKKRLPRYYPIFFSLEEGRITLKLHEVPSANDLLLLRAFN